MESLVREFLGDSEPDREKEIAFIASAILIACAKSDDEEDPDEEETILDIMGEATGLDDSQLDRLITLIDDKLREEGLSAFIDSVNETFHDDEKILLLENLWRVAYADGRLAQFEQAFIRRISDAIGMDDDAVESARVAVSP